MYFYPMSTEAQKHRILCSKQNIALQSEETKCLYRDNSDKKTTGFQKYRQAVRFSHAAELFTNNYLIAQLFSSLSYPFGKSLDLTLLSWESFCSMERSAH